MTKIAILAAMLFALAGCIIPFGVPIPAPDNQPSQQSSNVDRN